MTKSRILLVEDEEDLQELVEYNLERAGYEISSVSTGEEGLDRAREDPPDLLILDLMLPGLGGVELCKDLREREATVQLPIMMLTARGEESDVVRGLEAGADDYVTKPFRPRELVARVGALLRRSRAPGADDDAEIERGDLRINPGRREVHVAGEPVAMTHMEFAILHLLAARPGWVFTRSQIIAQSRGEDAPVTDRSVDVHVVNLRKKLGDRGQFIETVRSVGYRFRE